MADREALDPGLIPRAPRELLVLERALRDLGALRAEERRMVMAEIDRLAIDALPRGAEALHGRHRNHLRLRIGHFRLLYELADGVLTVVALLAD